MVIIVVQVLLVHILMMMLKKKDIWVAHWNVNKPSFKGKWGVWQYSEKGKVNGISGYVDTDHGDINYENIIKKGHYNGY